MTPISRQQNCRESRFAQLFEKPDSSSYMSGVNIGDSKISKHTTVADMALDIGVAPKAFRAALRNAQFSSWKSKQDRQVKIGSEEYSAMRTVLVTLLRPGRPF